MLRPIVFSFIFATLTLPSFAQTEFHSYAHDDGVAPREHPLDMTRSIIEVSFVPKEGLVKGKVTHRFMTLRQQVSSFFLDGIQMTYDEVLLDGQPVPSRADSAGITIFPRTPLAYGSEHELVIRYRAHPRRGLYFIGWNDPKGKSRTQIWTQGEAIDNRHWIPMFDEKNDKLLTEVIATFDKDYEVLSNGKLVDKKINTDGTQSWHYAISHPHAPYLVMLGIGKYAIKETHSVSGVPLHLYYYPEWKDRVEPTYIHSEAIMDFLEKEIGLPYPWESYSQIPVQDYMFGAMENTTATVAGDFYFVDQRGLLDRNYIGVNAHELAHQWFGDYVTGYTNADIWLQESFATYYNLMFEREVFGSDHFDWGRRGAQNASIEATKKDLFGVGHSEGGGTRVYGKGAFVLNMLKYVVGGRDAYNRAIRHYLDKHPYANVDSHDLLIAFEESTGMDLHWFWDEWVYRGGEPSFTVTYTENGRQTQWTIAQSHPLSDVVGARKGLYKMPIVLETHYTDGSSDQKEVWVEKQTEIISMPVPDGKTTAFVLFDPGNIVMHTVQFKKSPEMLRAQALNAGKMLDRYDAVVAMKSWPADEKRETLIKAFGQEKFFALRAEVISQLANDNDPASNALFRKALTDGDANVRKAALRSVDPQKIGLIPEFEKMLTDSSYEIIETALTKLSLSNPGGVKGYLEKTKDVEGNLGKNVKVRWLETAYTSTGKVSHAEALVDLTSPSYEFRTRVNAMNALKRTGYFSDDLLRNCVDAILSPNDRLSNPAKDVLLYYFNQDKYKKRISDYVKAGHWEQWQAGMLTGFGA